MSVFSAMHVNEHSLHTQPCQQELQLTSGLSRGPAELPSQHPRVLNIPGPEVTQPWLALSLCRGAQGQAQPWAHTRAQPWGSLSTCREKPSPPAQTVLRQEISHHQHEHQQLLVLPHNPTCPASSSHGDKTAQHSKFPLHS